jgi:hypothetical protein
MTGSAAALRRTLRENFDELASVRAPVSVYAPAPPRAALTPRAMAGNARNSQLMPARFSAYVFTYILQARAHEGERVDGG